MTKTNARAIANNVAVAEGFPSAAELVTTLNNGVQTGDQAAIATATSFQQNLTLKILEQVIEPNGLTGSKNINFVKQFLDTDFVGNAVERLVVLPTGDEPFDPNQFIPVTPEIPVTETSIQQYYEMDDAIPNQANLTAGSFSRRKNQTFSKIM